MNFLDNMYLGKITSCHTQALFNAYFKNNNYKDYLLFEIMTTNPFGVKFIPNDPNRVLDSYLDFDLGLDRALKLLDIDFRIEYNNSIYKSIEILKEWLKFDSVVVGPLNMEYLTYLYYPQLYKGLDHYFVVQKYENDKVYLLDSEGFINISLSEIEFIKAWKGDKIIEGRGEFIMRQILTKNITIDFKKLDSLYFLILDNLYQAQKDSAYKRLSKINLKKNHYLLNSFTYAIPNRLQKIFIQKEFFRDKNIKIISILDNQIEIFSDILSQVLNNQNITLNNFEYIDKLENDLIGEMEKLNR